MFEQDYLFIYNFKEYNHASDILYLNPPLAIYLIPSLNNLNKYNLLASQTWRVSQRQIMPKRRPKQYNICPKNNPLNHKLIVIRHRLPLHLLLLLDLLELLPLVRLGIGNLEPLAIEGVDEPVGKF